MKRTFKFAVCCLAAVFFIPFTITLILSGVGLDKERIGLALTESLTGKDKQMAVSMNYAVGSESMDIEEYIAGVIAPAYDYCSNEEFLKAMAVMCRTYIAWCNENNLQNDTVFFNDIELEERWGEEWQEKKAAVTLAVRRTEGEKITNGGTTIYPYCHMLTSGYTRNLRDECSYLCEVMQTEDSLEDDYINIYDFADKEFAALIKKNIKDVYFDERNAAEQLQVVEKTTGGYIVLIQVGNVVVDGDTFASMTGLASPSFTYIKTDEGIRFTVKGNGNGYGLSVAGAAKKAEQGASYKEILNYYFENITCIK